jgi:hypothetical protein
VPLGEAGYSECPSKNADLGNIYQVLNNIEQVTVFLCRNGTSDHASAPSNEAKVVLKELECEGNLNHHHNKGQNGITSLEVS